jgi:hypothetical protein
MPDNFQYDVFLSHNQADKPRVQRLTERLRAAGLRVWFDEWVIWPGDNIAREVEDGLEASRALVLCLSPAALGSGWVTLERSTVLFRNPANAGSFSSFKSCKARQIQPFRVFLRCRHKPCP